jgi:hypothetical protein
VGIETEKDRAVLVIGGTNSSSNSQIRGILGPIRSLIGGIDIRVHMGLRVFSHDVGCEVRESRTPLSRVKTDTNAVKLQVITVKQFRI